MEVFKVYKLHSLTFEIGTKRKWHYKIMWHCKICLFFSERLREQSPVDEDSDSGRVTHS